MNKITDKQSRFRDMEARNRLTDKERRRERWKEIKQKIYTAMWTQKIVR